MSAHKAARHQLPREPPAPDRPPPKLPELELPDELLDELCSRPANRMSFAIYACFIGCKDDITYLRVGGVRPIKGDAVSSW